MPRTNPRLVAVRRQIEELWAARGDGRWLTIERFLSECSTPNEMSAARSVALAEPRSNVIVLADRILERRRGDRRKP